VIYVENSGDFVVPSDAVDAVHSGKVIFNTGSDRCEPREAREGLERAAPFIPTGAILGCSHPEYDDLSRNWKDLLAGLPVPMSSGPRQRSKCLERVARAA
jgi:hypothetical protein